MQSILLLNGEFLLELKPIDVCLVNLIEGNPKVKTGGGGGKSIALLIIGGLDIDEELVDELNLLLLLATSRSTS